MSQQPLLQPERATALAPGGRRHARQGQRPPRHRPSGQSRQQGGNHLGFLSGRSQNPVIFDHDGFGGRIAAFMQMQGGGPPASAVPPSQNRQSNPAVSPPDFGQFRSGTKQIEPGTNPGPGAKKRASIGLLFQRLPDQTELGRGRAGTERNAARPLIRDGWRHGRNPPITAGGNGLTAAPKLTKPGLGCKRFRGGGQCQKILHIRQAENENPFKSRNLSSWHDMCFDRIAFASDHPKVE